MWVRVGKHHTPRLTDHSINKKVRGQLERFGRKVDPIWWGSFRN